MFNLPEAVSIIALMQIVWHLLLYSCTLVPWLLSHRWVAVKTIKYQLIQNVV